MKRQFGLLVVALALVVAACGDGAGTVATTTAAEAGIGTEDNPIQVLFVPSVSAEEIVAGGEILQTQLADATGLSFEVSVPTSYAATIEEMCASPENTMGFIPAQAYVLANDLCGVEVALKSIRFGFDVYWTQIIAQRDSDIESIEDLEGASWAYPDPGSTSGFLVPSGMFEGLGIEPGETVETGGHGATARAVYNDEADFGTTFYSPPVDAEGNVLWEFGDDPDVPADLVEQCEIDAEGEIVCGDYLPRDARRDIREEAPDVIQQVKIVGISEPIPNDTLSFSPDFPDDVRQQIVDALQTFAEDDPDGFEAAFDAYSWSGVADTTDAEFDFIRELVETLDIELEDL